MIPQVNIKHEPLKHAELQKLKGLNPAERIVIETEQQMQLTTEGELIVSRPAKRNVVTLAGAMVYTYDGIPKSRILGIFEGEKDGEIKFVDIDAFLKKKKKDL